MPLDKLINPLLAQIHQAINSFNSNSWFTITRHQITASNRHFPIITISSLTFFRLSTFRCSFRENYQQRVGYRSVTLRLTVHRLDFVNVKSVVFEVVETNGCSGRDFGRSLGRSCGWVNHHHVAISFRDGLEVETCVGGLDVDGHG